jgi:hypothetical protein
VKNRGLSLSRPLDPHPRTAEGALPGNALEQVITQAKALDMTKVHAEVASQQQK